MGKRKREEEEVFQVEVILGARVNDECKWEYLIRWAGYGEEEDTWEPTENIEKNCQRLIWSFWKCVGIDDEDYHPGDECTPTDDWIQMEREKFYQDERKKGKPPRAKKKRSRSVKRFVSDEGLSVASSSKGKNPLVKREPSEDDTILTVKKKTRRVVSDSDSDSDEPLARSIKKSSSVAIVKKTKTPSTPQSNRKSRKDDSKKKEIPRSLSPSGSLFSGSEAPDIASSPSHAISVHPTQLRSSGPSVKRPSKPTELKIRIPRPAEKSISSSTARPPTSTLSASNTPNVSVKIPNFLRVPSSFGTTLNEPSGSNLSVKSRLYQTAMVPMNPKNTSVESSRVKPPLAMGAAAAAKKSSLGNLNFKKRSTAVGASPTITSDDLKPRIPSFSSPDPSPVISPHVPNFAARSTSPVSAYRIPRNDPTMAALNAAPPSPIEHMAGLSLDSPSGSGITNDFMPPVNSTDQPSFPVNEVDSFLQSVMPLEMAAPFETAPAETDDDAIPLPIRTSLSTSGRPNITGKTQMTWKWTGEIQIQIQSEREGEVEGEDGHPPRQSPRREVQVFCTASITDVVQLAQGGMPFRVVLSEDVKSLTFQTFLPIDHLEDVIPACKLEATARFVSADDEESGRGGYDRFGKFADYLRSNRQVAISPVYMDDIHTANIMCLSPAFFNRIERIAEVPTELTTTADTSSGLVVVLFSWLLSREQLSEHNLRTSNNQPLQHELERQHLDLVSNGKLSKNTESKCTVGILGYPQWLHDWLKEWQRSFSIWPGGVDNINGQSRSLETSATTNLEINLLHSLLTKGDLAVTAPIESEDTSIGVIFIHVQGLGSITKLPHLRRRRETVETMFVVFGTSSPSVSVSQVWPSCGFWEVYPIGGVVTFTAKALLRHPDMILARTQQIAEYPLWTSYIIPTVLGMAVTLYYRDRNEDPMEAFDRDDFAYEFLLDAIYEGEIGLLRCPPPISNVTTKHWKATDEHGEHPSTVLSRHYEKDDDEVNWRDLRSEWFLDQIDSIFRERRETLEFCLKEFGRVYGTVSPHQWDSILGEEIAEDIKIMQVQPAIAREYRRYVVLKAEEEKGNDDELEWLSPDMFEVYNESGTPPPDSPSVV